VSNDSLHPTEADPFLLQANPIHEAMATQFAEELSLLLVKPVRLL
jgi:hypothetical protein